MLREPHVSPDLVSNRYGRYGKWARTGFVIGVKNLRRFYSALRGQRKPLMPKASQRNTSAEDVFVSISPKIQNASKWQVSNGKMHGKASDK